jgi:glutamate synthase domain-containing protein 3
VELTLIGDANDYTGKGLSGGVLTVTPPEDSLFVAEENVIIGNTVLYGASGGRAFFRGARGRAVRGAQLGRQRRRRGRGRPRLRVHDRWPRDHPRPDRPQLRAGMSGGVAYVFDEDDTFSERCNMGLVGFDPIEDSDAIELHNLISEHAQRTGSPVAQRILDAWDESLPRFKKVMPHDYKRALKELAEAEEPMRATEDADAATEVVGAPATGTGRNS